MASQFNKPKPSTKSNSAKKSKGKGNGFNPKQTNSSNSKATNAHGKRPLEEAVQARARQRAARFLAKLPQKETHKEAAVLLKDEGNELFRQGDYQGAISQYMLAIELDPSKAVYKSNLAQAYLKIGSYDEAEVAAHSALLNDPKNVKARYRRGLARKALDLVPGAITDFEVVLKLDQALTEAAAELATALERCKATCGDTNFPRKKHASPRPEADPHFDDSMSNSDSDDANHVGNGTPCHDYNHKGCKLGTNCPKMHAPDEKSIRDDLGRNFCVYVLLGRCHFGKDCFYSHDREYLPKGGWWNDTARKEEMKKKLESRNWKGEFMSFRKAIDITDKTRLLPRVKSTREREHEMSLEMRAMGIDPRRLRYGNGMIPEWAEYNF